MQRIRIYENILDKIFKLCEEIDKDKINIMEVCGTHTHLIYESGLKQLLPEKINLISGPGCPVCVTSTSFIDNAIDIGRNGTTIVTFGDIAKVRGSVCSLVEARNLNLKVIYSMDKVIEFCLQNSLKEFLFLGVGFETTSPIIASTIKKAKDYNLKNLWFYNSLKVMPPIIDKILSSSSVDGVILPGNVAIVEGEEGFKHILEKYNIPSVIAGFSYEHILISIYYILKNIYMKSGSFYNIYKSVVRVEGNVKSRKILDDVFYLDNGTWRGIGNIPKSSMEIRDGYKNFDGKNKFNIKEKEERIKVSGCRCEEIIMGKISPEECELFKNVCNKENPVGPCMVSVEGACYSACSYI
ncbi:MAG: hydrogenase formation protein HypD [Clostridium argentinense]|uniref:Hydrogenase formation protein HypD n=1 Tax=Clostridium faecium TaxID=2762223 RepID=A0ABR8YWT9_9CLOT|nr:MULTISPECIES: hydrogenase formation protein HypD [Clostridium]MBD8048733.1 hydrogenase formation protein HypD [Clostridium faecium]MBS5822467.1 hydrogenase formation protein HypD [Clostridium argentinense]MDU1350127.1 hydrogenase formation protein HypD [Clostridium argentinense]